MGQESKKIILLTTAFKPLVGGSEIAIEQIARHLPGVFFEVITAKFNSRNKREETIGDVHIYRLGFGSKIDKYLLPVLAYFKSRRLLKETTIVHAYQASYAAIAGYLLKLSNPRIKFILTLQEGKNISRQNFILRKIRNLIIKKADKITAISTYLADFAKKLKPDGQIFVVPNGVDSNLFKKMDMEGQKIKSRLGIKEDERVIVTVSRLVPKNGVDVLIRAFKILSELERTPKTRLLIVGSGPIAEELEGLVSSLGLGLSVIFVGEIYYEDLPRYLSAADVFARPSHSEGLGNAFLEAMATGVPIIGTPVGGIPDFLEDGRTGLFCQVGNPTDLAKKIKNVLVDIDLRKRLIDNGQDLVKSKYSWQTVAKQFERIYEDR